MRGIYLFRRSQGLLLLCLLLSLSCRVRSTRPSAETLPTPQVPSLAPPPAPVDPEEEEFWPSIALRPITPPDITSEPVAPAPAPTAKVGAEIDQLMMAPVPELPPLVWVPGFADTDTDVSVSELDAAAMRLARVIQRQGRRALQPALVGLAQSLWPEGESTWAGSLSLQSSLGRAAQVRLGQAGALPRALSAVWGVAPPLTLSPGAEDALSVHRGSIGPAVLLMRVPGALPAAAVGDTDPERPRAEYIAVSVWGTTSSGQAMGVTPVWQVAGEHGVVVAFSDTADPNVSSGAQAAYAALAQEKVRSAAELGLALMKERSSDARQAVAVLRQNDAWVASTEPSPLVGMTEILRQNQRLAETSAPQVDSPSRVGSNPSAVRSRPEREAPRAPNTPEPAHEVRAAIEITAPPTTAPEPSVAPTTGVLATAPKAAPSKLVREPLPHRPVRTAPSADASPTQATNSTRVSPKLQTNPVEQ